MHVGSSGLLKLVYLCVCVLPAQYKYVYEILAYVINLLNVFNLGFQVWK